MNYASLKTYNSLIPKKDPPAAGFIAEEGTKEI
jgi:hypothetical protein